MARKGENAATKAAAAEAAVSKAAAEVAATQKAVAVETDPDEPTLEKKVSDLQTATKDAVERLDVVDERLDELENKGDRVQEEIQGLLDETVDRMDQQDNSLKDEIANLKKVVQELAQQAEGQLLERIKEGLAHDPVAETLIGYTKEGKSRRYWLEGDLLYTRGNRLYIPQFGNLRKHLMKESHDSKWAGHPGIHRTIALLADQYYWPHMGRDVEAYVKTCLVCQFSKYATFIPASKVCPAEEAACLFLKHVVKYWGVPKTIFEDKVADYHSRAAMRASLNQVGENVTSGRPMIEVHAHQGSTPNPIKLSIQPSPLGECQKGKSIKGTSQLQSRDSID
ncbi:hypothetical protein GQ457_06G009410 [Hibiscus cannabinus]